MEVFLLLWDEIDDLLAPARLLFTGYPARPARVVLAQAEPAVPPLAAVQPLI
jgi:hypothetical protein